MPSHSPGPEFIRTGQEKSSTELNQLSVNDLALCCAEETNKFLRQNTSNDRYCLEMFRRAIVRRNDDAWASIYQQYAPLVLTWVNQHQSAASMLGQDGKAKQLMILQALLEQAPLVALLHW